MDEKTASNETTEPTTEAQVTVPQPTPVPHKKVLPLHLLGSPILRQVASPVAEITDTVRRLADLMVDTMLHVQGIGLAAPQIGIPVRLFVMIDQKANQVYRLCNPVVNAKEGQQFLKEGCLSQPGLEVEMTRPQYMAVNAIEISTGQSVIVEGTELEAAILAHEMDHLDGHLICDALSRLKRDMYRKKLHKKLKQQDRAEKGAVRLKKDHLHYTEPKR